MKNSRIVVVTGGRPLLRKDIDGFHRKIAELLENPEKQKQFGEMGRRKVEERFTWPYIAKRIVKIYEELLEKKKPLVE